ncbi:MAG: hypothetical protein QM757_25490 [Paludibaculum sp.]
MTTIHANTPRDGISRLEVMVSLANCQHAVDLASASRLPAPCTYWCRRPAFSDGSRRVTNITEVTGMEGEVITLQDIFVFEKRGLVSGRASAGPLRGDRHPAEVLRKASCPRASACGLTCSMK